MDMAFTMDGGFTVHVQDICNILRINLVLDETVLHLKLTFYSLFLARYETDGETAAQRLSFVSPTNSCLGSDSWRLLLTAQRTTCLHIIYPSVHRVVHAA
jgi:hypothetical protein